jgi:hypothetical protein
MLPAAATEAPPIPTADYIEETYAIVAESGISARRKTPHPVDGTAGIEGHAQLAVAPRLDGQHACRPGRVCDHT